MNPWSGRGSPARVSRRSVCLALSAAAVAARPARAAFRSRFEAHRFDFDGRPDRAEAQAILDAILAGRVPDREIVTLEAPDIADNGAAVPVRIAVDCAMTAADYPRVVHLLAMENPFTEVAKYWFTPHGGVAEVNLRCRLRASGPIIAVAEMNDGRAAMARRDISVTLGSCS